MTSVWCVRAESGRYAKHFIDGGYVAIGWMQGCDLSKVKLRTIRPTSMPPATTAAPTDTAAG